jgi:hypothetical protein
MGMDSDGREDARIGLGEGDGRSIPLDSVTRTDRDQRVDTALESPSQYVGTVIIVFACCDMTMAIEPHVDSFSRTASGRRVSKAQ